MPEYWAPGPEGFTWAAETEAKALLGTPNGSGIAWLLIQHKRQLGWKMVDSVTLFWKDGHEGDLGSNPSLLFRIKDVEDGRT